jgi:hypothetical protein
MARIAPPDWPGAARQMGRVDHGLSCGKWEAKEEQLGCGCAGCWGGETGMNTDYTDFHGLAEIMSILARREEDVRFGSILLKNSRLQG